MFLGYYRHIWFFEFRGGERIWTRREGGAKNFGRVAKGGRKILDFKFFGILRKNKGTRIKSFAQIRSSARDIRICGICRPPCHKFWSFPYYLTFGNMFLGVSIICDLGETEIFTRGGHFFTMHQGRRWFKKTMVRAEQRNFYPLRRGVIFNLERF